MTLHYPTCRTCALSLLFFVVALVLSSCDDDDVEKGKDFTVTIDASQTYIGTCYFISDEDGNAVAFHQVTEPGIFELKPSAPYRDDTYSFTVLDRIVAEGTPRFSGRTYAGIEAKSMTWKTSAGDLNNRITNFIFTGLASSSERCTVSTDRSTGYAMRNGDDLWLESHGNTKLLAIVENVDLRTAKYRLFDNNGSDFAGGSATIDLSLVTQTLPTRTLHAPAGITPEQTIVYGIKNNGITTEYYRIIQSLPDPNPLVVPDPGATFDGYFYNTRFSVNNYYHTVSKSSPNFEGLEFEISGASAQAGSVTFTTTGSYDFGEVMFRTSDRRNLWNIYVPSSANGPRTAKVPKMPAELLGEVNETSVNDLSFVAFRATDHQTIDGFQDYVQKVTSMPERQETKTVIITAENIGG